MTELIVITYGDEQTGFTALDKLEELEKMKVVTLVDAAVAVKDQKGKVKIKQTLENKHTGSAAGWGGFWGLLIGLLVLSPIFWGVVGALIGGIVGKTADLGIDNKFIKEVGDVLEPGNSALFLLVAKAVPEKVLPEMEKFGGTVLQTSLAEEDEKKLRKALEHDQVRAAAEDTLELDSSN